MSPRPSSAARVTDEPDFEWPPAGDELAVYDVGPDPWHSVHAAASEAFQTRRRETVAVAPAPTRAVAAPKVQGPTSRPQTTRVSRPVVVAIGIVGVLAALVAAWVLLRPTPLPVPVETVHHPAPAVAPPPRLKIVATYRVDRPAPTASGSAAAAGSPDAPAIPVAPAAAHHAVADAAPIDAPRAP